jgi:hypothetical protein
MEDFFIDHIDLSSSKRNSDKLLELIGDKKWLFNYIFNSLTIEQLPFYNRVFSSVESFKLAYYENFSSNNLKRMT